MGVFTTEKQRSCARRATGHGSSSAAGNSGFLWATRVWFAAQQGAVCDALCRPSAACARASPLEVSPPAADRQGHETVALASPLALRITCTGCRVGHCGCVDDAADEERVSPDRAPPRPRQRPALAGDLSGPLGAGSAPDRDRGSQGGALAARPPRVLHLPGIGRWPSGMAERWRPRGGDLSQWDVPLCLLDGFAADVCIGLRRAEL